MSNHQYTATARAIACQDIVESVCQLLTPSFYLYQFCRRDDDKKINQRTLARLARTCKAFSNPALRVLWRRLDHIYILLRLLPQYLPSPPTYIPHANVTGPTLSSAPNDSDWSRLQSYAIRIKQLKWSPSNRIDSNSWNILYDMCGGGRLLPRLERLLNFDISSDNEAVLSHLFFPTSLLYLSIMFDACNQRIRNPEHIQAMLQAIVSHSPNLRHLTFGSLRGVSTRLIMSFYPIEKLRHIQTLSFPPDLPLDNVLFAYCASLATLRHLTCRIDTRYHDVTKRPEIRGAFRSLAQLSLYGRAEEIVWLFTQISPDSLRDISLVVDTETDVDDLVTSITKVLEIVSPSLRCFSLEITAEASEPLPLLKLLEPLLDVSAVEKVAVEASQPFLISPDDIVRMATGWPALRVLHIFEWGPSPSTSPLPALVLEHVAVRCPCLESLKLPKLDFTELPPQAQARVLNHGLRDLWFHPLSDDCPTAYKPISFHFGAQVTLDQEGIHSPGVWLNAALLVNRLFPAVDLDRESMRRMRISGYGGPRLTAYLYALRARHKAVAPDKLQVGRPSLPHDVTSSS